MTYIVYYNLGGNYRIGEFSETEFERVFSSGKFDCNEAWLLIP